MRICYISRSILPSREANAVHVMKMCAAYAELGHRVLLLVPRFPGGRDLPPGGLHAFYGVDPSFAVRRIPLPAWLPGTITFGWMLPALAFLWRADLVHSRSLAPAWGAARFFRLPTLYEAHDAPSDQQRLKAMLDALIGSPRFVRMIVISEALARHVRGRLPVDPLVAPDGVDARLVGERLDRDEARSRLGIDPGGRRLAVYAGNLYEGRGIDLILQVARLRTDHLFVLVGGKERDLDRWRKEADDADNVRFLGFRPPAEIPQYLDAADVLLMPHGARVAAAGGGDIAAFTSPMKMFEYLAAGRPVLASSLPVLGEVLEDGRNAVLLPHDDVERWSHALSRLATDASLEHHLAEHARSDARGYTWRERARRILAPTDVP